MGEIIEWNDMSEAPKDGSWIYAKYQKWWGDTPVGKYEVMKVRWMMWCPKRGGELIQGWTKDGETFVHSYVDGYMRSAIMRPEGWVSTERMEGKKNDNK